MSITKEDLEDWKLRATLALRCSQLNPFEQMAHEHVLLLIAEVERLRCGISPRVLAVLIKKYNIPLERSDGTMSIRGLSRLRRLPEVQVIRGMAALDDLGGDLSDEELREISETRLGRLPWKTNLRQYSRPDGFSRPPEGSNASLPQVIAVRPFPEYLLVLQFKDGELRVFDMEPMLWGEMFEPLRVKELFNQVRVEDGTIVWPNGADLDPEDLYASSNLLFPRVCE